MTQVRRPQQRAPGTKSKGSAVQRPIVQDGATAGQSLYYVLLIAGPAKPGRTPLVEARLSADIAGRGVTEYDAVMSLLDRIRSFNSEATLERLRVWRSLWRPPHPAAISFEAE